MLYDPHKMRLDELEEKLLFKLDVLKLLAAAFCLIIVASLYFIYTQFAAPGGPEMAEVYLCLGFDGFCSLLGLWAWLDYRHARRALARIETMIQNQRTSQQSHKVAEMALNLEHESRGLRNSKRLKTMLMVASGLIFCFGIFMIFTGIDMMSKGKSAGGTVLGGSLIWFMIGGFIFKHAYPMGSSQQTKVNTLQRELKVLRTRQRAKAGDISVAQPQQSGQLSQAQSVQSGALSESEGVILDFSDEQVAQTHSATQKQHHDS